MEVEKVSQNLNSLQPEKLKKKNARQLLPLEFFLYIQELPKDVSMLQTRVKTKVKMLWML